MCVYDRIVYFNIVKKDINILSKKGVLRGGDTMLPMGGTKKFSASAKKFPPPLHKGSRIYNPTHLPLYM